MCYNKLRCFSVFLTVIVVVSGCSTAGIKQENEELKQRIQQEEQTRQDYADKLRAASATSEKEQSHSQAEMAAMRKDLDKALEENQAVVKKLKDLTIVEMEHNVLFKSGQVELNKEGKMIVRDIAAAFNKYPGYHMRIEGHTDNMPVHSKLKPSYFSNWELSAARAASVARYMIFALKVPRNNLSIAGYADNRPVASNDTVEGRAKNRRIRVVIFKNYN